MGSTPDQLPYNGEVTSFRTLCVLATDGGGYLDGRTLEHRVALAPTYDPPYNGASWFAVPAEETNTFALNCMGPLRTDGEQNVNLWLIVDIDNHLALRQSAQMTDGQIWRWRIVDDPSIDAVDSVTISFADGPGRSGLLRADPVDQVVDVAPSPETLLHSTSWQRGAGLSDTGTPPPPHDDQ